MSVINEVVEAVMDLIDETGAFANITRGALPTGNGLSCEVGPTAPEAVYLDKNTYTPLDLTINGKHSSLRTLQDTMWHIHEHLTRLKQYPEDFKWQIVDITTKTNPQIIDREGNNAWIMASSLNIKFYQKGE